ncbi:solute carrier family 35 member C2 [Trichinella spiralis]|uniref:solute carrier family 35 member C2 n=1 Tax=Trichinella spiralis TaxID=6334 RepID=UPI0001EFDF2A|nr:solute carrier family 35 member C2 [Trichinella spiralis]
MSPLICIYIYNFCCRGSFTERAVYFVNYGVIHSWMKMGISNCSSRLLESDLIKALLAGILYYPTSLALTFYQQWQSTLAFTAKSGFYSSGRSTPLQPALLASAHRWILACRIGASNTPAYLCTVSYTMGKSSTIIFILLAAVALSLEKCVRVCVCVCAWDVLLSDENCFIPLRSIFQNASTVSVVCLIAVGVFFVNYKSTQFSWTGFFLIQGASMCGGLRWAASQKLLQKEILGLSNPFDMIYHVQPWMVVGILPLFFAFEARDLALISTTAYGSKPSSVLRLSALVLIGGLLATLMEVFEYLLLLYTSSLTLSVCSVGKELVTLLLAYRYRNDRMSLVNTFGLAMCIFGTALHVTMRTKRLRDPKAPQLTRPTVVYTELRDRQYAALSEASSTDSEEF